MLFNTTQYVLFLPFVILIYYILPTKVRYLWLLLASYYFYMQWNPVYVFLLLFCTILTYIGGLYIEKHKQVKHPKISASSLCLFACIFISLSLLGFFKYFNFPVNIINYLLGYLQCHQIPCLFDILLPVGISFYILQSLGYLIDVYRNEIYAEKNFFKYALFVSFFRSLLRDRLKDPNIY